MKIKKIYICASVCVCVILLYILYICGRIGCEPLQRDGKENTESASTGLHDVNIQWRYLFINVDNTWNIWQWTNTHTQWYYGIVIESTKVKRKIENGTYRMNKKKKKERKKREKLDERRGSGGRKIDETFLNLAEILFYFCLISAHCSHSKSAKKNYPSWIVILSLGECVCVSMSQWW